MNLFVLIDEENILETQAEFETRSKDYEFSKEKKKIYDSSL